MIVLSMTLKETEQEIGEKILKSICKHLNKTIANGQMRADLTGRIADAIRISLYQQPEEGSEKLRTHLGVDDFVGAMHKIYDVVAGSTKIVVSFFRTAGNAIQGYVKITASPSSYYHELQADFAKYTYENAGGTHVIPWLEWLLLRGDEPIILDYTVKHWPKRSRTQDLVMRRSTRSWSVPPEFSGVADNNFITRAINAAVPEIEKIIADEVRRKI